MFSGENREQHSSVVLWWSPWSVQQLLEGGHYHWCQAPWDLWMMRVLVLELGSPPHQFQSHTTRPTQVRWLWSVSVVISGRVLPCPTLRFSDKSSLFRQGCYWRWGSANIGARCNRGRHPVDLYSDSLMAIFFFLLWFFTMVELSKAVIAHNERLSVTLLPPWTAFVRANGQAGSYNIAPIVSQCENLLVVLWICGDHVHNLTDLANNLGQVPTQGFVGAWVILDINGCFNGWAFMTWRVG